MVQALMVRLDYASILKNHKINSVTDRKIIEKKGILKQRYNFFRTKPSNKDKGEKKYSYDDSEVSSDSLEPTVMIHDEKQGQVQADAAGDEALTENIDHSDAGKLPPLVAPTTTPVLRRFNKDVSLQEDIMLRNILTHIFR